MDWVVREAGGDGDELAQRMLARMDRLRGKLWNLASGKGKKKER